MAFAPLHLMSRVIPNRNNRSLWWLLLGVGIPLSFAGPVVSLSVANALNKDPSTSEYFGIVLMNLGSLLCVLVVIAVVLSRVKHSLSSARQIFIGASAVLGVMVIRFGVTYLTGQFPFVESGFPALYVQFSLWVFGFATVIFAVLYSSYREKILDQALRKLNAAQASLIHEEETVRGKVFDHLHGALQAEFITVRRTLSDLEKSTSDPIAALTASKLNESLDRIYREEIVTITETLIPSGLQAGLLTAVVELQTRLQPATTVAIEFDPVVTALDDPMVGGLHQDIRLAAYRIIEESVTNAIRHSKARMIKVEIASSLVNAKAHLTTNVSHASDKDIKIIEGSGFSRMRARSEALGGTLRYGTSESGFTVSAELPLVRADGGRWSTLNVGSQF